MVFYRASTKAYHPQSNSWVNAEQGYGGTVTWKLLYEVSIPHGFVGEAYAKQGGSYTLMPEAGEADNICTLYVTMGESTVEVPANSNGSYTVSGVTGDLVFAATHPWGDGVQIVPPSCTEEGLEAYVCTKCGATRTQVISAAGHQYESVVTAPTCTKDGFTTNTCTDCGEVTVTDPTAATGHGWSSWTVLTAPGCTISGSQTRSCSCGQQETQTLSAMGHSYTNGACIRCGYSPDVALKKAADNNYYFYVNGEIAVDYVGFAENSCGNWYVKDGMVQVRYDGVVEVDGTGYLIKAGRVNTQYTGLSRRDGGIWLYFTEGVQDKAFTGVVAQAGMRVYVEDGYINFNKTAVVQDAGKQIFVKYGIWRDSFDGLARLESGEWIYMTDGSFDSTYNGVAKLNSLWVYVVDGCVKFTYSGPVEINGVTFNVKYGVVQL